MCKQEDKMLLPTRKRQIPILFYPNISSERNEELQNTVETDKQGKKRRE